MALSYTADPTTALNRGYGQFDIILTNWGNIGASADSRSVSTGSQNYSLAGLAIHPDSDVETVTIGGVAKFDPVAPIQTVSIDTPFIGDLPGPWGAAAVAKSLFNAFYLPVGSNVGAVFGFGMGAILGRPIFGGAKGSVVTPQYPVLRLIAFLRPSLYAPTERGPLYDTGGDYLTVGAGTTIMRVLSVPGRRRLRAVFKRGVAVGSCDVQLTAALNGSLDATAAAAIAEFALTAPQTLAAAGNQVTFDLPIPSSVDWVFVKTTLNAGAADLNWWIQAV
jgi:hypothetical protein